MKKLFTNDAFFAIVTWITAISAVPMIIAVFLYYNNPLIWACQIARIMIAAGLIVVYYSYKNHNKNVMKGMIGSVLTSIVLLVSTSLFVYEEYYLYSGIALALTLLLYINHFIINSDHNSKPGNIIFNQILSLVFAALMCVESISLIPYCVNTLDTVAQILACIGQPCCIFSIVCVESRLDAYRKNREAAGWTEEKGYPQGYVHEHEKNKNK